MLLYTLSQRPSSRKVRALRPAFPALKTVMRVVSNTVSSTLPQPHIPSGSESVFCIVLSPVTIRAGLP